MALLYWERKHCVLLPVQDLIEQSLSVCFDLCVEE